MTKTELDKYIETIKNNFDLVIDLSETDKIVFKPIDFATTVAIANKIAENVVSEYGDYRPEYKEPLLMYYLLVQSVEMDLGELNVEEMALVYNSAIGATINDKCIDYPWLLNLIDLIEEKIRFRKRMHCDPNSLVNSKISELIMKQLENEGKTEVFMNTLTEFSKSFNPDEIREYTKIASELNQAIQNPEVSDRFFERIQANAQDKRIKEADKVLDKAKKIIQMNEAKNVLANKR